MGRALLPDRKLMKADDISAEVDDFEEALENHVEGCDVVNTEPGDFEGLPLQTHQVLTFSTSQPSTSSSKTSLECFHYLQ